MDKTFHFEFPQIPALVEFPAPGKLSKVKSRPPGQFFFELMPGGCPGGCTQLELTETLLIIMTARKPCAITQHFR